MLYPSALEFLKSEVPYLRYDLQEVLMLKFSTYNMFCLWFFEVNFAKIRHTFLEESFLLADLLHVVVNPETEKHSQIIFQTIYK